MLYKFPCKLSHTVVLGFFGAAIAYVHLSTTSLPTYSQNVKNGSLLTISCPVFTVCCGSKFYQIRIGRKTCQ